MTPYYMKYVFECRKHGLVPMGKQDWMQLGMPDSPFSREHKLWLGIEDPAELERRAQLFERISGTSKS
jgi:hypothetical protein